MQKYAEKKLHKNAKKKCKYMHLPHKFTSIAYICKNMQQKNAYEKYVSMKFICIIIVRIVGLQCDVTRHNSWVLELGTRKVCAGRDDLESCTNWQWQRLSQY